MEWLRRRRNAQYHDGDDVFGGDMEVERDVARNYAKGEAKMPEDTQSQRVFRHRFSAESG
jgi:hypothetical protein